MFNKEIITNNVERLGVVPLSNTKRKQSLNQKHPMKKQILTIGLIAALIGSIATGCSSKKNMSSSDSTAKDTSKMAPMPMKTDTGMHKDTMKRDTVHH